MTDMGIQTTADHEVAFTVYMNVAGRSLLKVSELTGVPLGTVRYWCTHHRWKDTADALEYQARTANRNHILSELDLGMPTALKNIKTLMTDASSEKVQLDASKYWTELWSKYRDLVSPTSDTSDTSDSLADTPDADLFAVLKTEANR